MIHGLIGSISALDVIKYVKKVNPKCRVVVDTDFYNSKNKFNQGFLRLKKRKIKNLQESQKEFIMLPPHVKNMLLTIIQFQSTNYLFTTR